MRTRFAVSYLVSAGVVLGVAALLVPTSSAASAGRTTLSVYAVVAEARFINHADDRQRGAIKNPFNADAAALAAGAATKEVGKGPYPGDQAIYGFRLYSNATLKNRIGTATYACTFNFDKRALCTAAFDLHGGSLFASGPASFGGFDFTLAVTGGTSAYQGHRGQVSAKAPARSAAKNESEFDFIFK